MFSHCNRNKNKDGWKAEAGDTNTNRCLAYQDENYATEDRDKGYEEMTGD